MLKYLVSAIDYFVVLRSGLFQHRAYARVYWGKRGWYYLSLFHYIIRGEKKGYIPCPFFDPDHAENIYTDKKNRNRLANFIRLRCRGSGSDLFDAEYVVRSAYFVNYLKEKYNHAVSPWLHYTKSDFRYRGDPSESLSMDFVTGTVFGWPCPQSYEDYSFRVIEYMQHKKQSQCVNFSKNKIEFLRNIENFHSSRETEFVKIANKNERKYLLYIQTDGSHDRSLHASDRNYDLFLSYYAGKHECGDVEYCITHRGTKVSAINSVIKARSEIFYRYKYILFLDDDVNLDIVAINKLFVMADAHGFKLCQASLSSDSHTGLNVLYHKPNNTKGFRLVSGVEIMMPMISNDALKSIEPLLSQGISGWGLDIKMGILIRAKFGEKVAVVDSIEASHQGVPNVYHGAFYKLLYAAGITPKMELQYHVGKNRPTIYEIM